MAGYRFYATPMQQNTGTVASEVLKLSACGKAVSRSEIVDGIQLDCTNSVRLSHSARRSLAGGMRHATVGCDENDDG